MPEKKRIGLAQILELVKIARDNGLDKDPRIKGLINCILADNTDVESYDLLSQLVNPYLVKQTLRTNPFPAPPKEVDGEIEFAVAEGNRPVGFMPDELHVLIAGEPGTGKTTVANFFIAPAAMQQKIKCWFFVKARDTEKLIKICREEIIAVDFDEQIRFNLLQPPKNVTRHGWYAKLWDMFIQAEGIYDGTKNLLIDLSYDLAAEYEKLGIEPSLFELYDFIKGKKFDRGSRSIHYAESALNRLGGILKGPLRNAIDCSSGCLEELVNKNVIFNIGDLPASQQVFIVNALISWLFCYKENNKTEKRHFLIIDDAMLLFDANFEKRPDRGMPIINQHLAEVRKAKINMIVIGQCPSLMGQGIFGTSSTKIMFTLSDSNDTDRMLDSMGVHDQLQRQAARLLVKEERHMLVKFSSRYPKPFPARMIPFPQMERIDKMEITKEEKRRNNSKYNYILKEVKPRKPYHEAREEEKKEIKDEKNDLLEEILKDIYLLPFVSSTSRANKYIKNKNKADSIYNSITKEMYAEPVFLNLKGRGGQTKFFWPTKKGCELIGKSRLPEGSGGKSSTHIFIQHYLADYLKSKGYKRIEIEKEIEGKKIDLFCVKDEKKIGIEICVSTQKTEHINIEKDKGKCDSLIIICLDNKEKKKLIEQLGELAKQVEIYALYEFLKEV